MQDTHGDPDANPHRTRLFLFWNPDIGQLEDKATLQRPKPGRAMMFVSEEVIWKKTTQWF